MAKANPERMYQVKLRPTKKEPDTVEVVVSARYMRVNNRGDLCFSQTGVGYGDGPVVATFASGSWLSAHETKETPRGTG